MDERTAASHRFMTAPKFARSIKVSKQAIYKAIKAGRIPAYDATFSKVAADYPGQKFVDKEEATHAFRLSRARFDDATWAEAVSEIERALDPTQPDSEDADIPASPTLVAARLEKEGLQTELLRMRLARERGELISRQAQIDAMESAGRLISSEIQMMPFWAEEITAAARSGGVPAVMSLLRAKAFKLCDGLADKLAAGTDDQDEPDRS